MSEATLPPSGPELPEAQNGHHQPAITPNAPLPEAGPYGVLPPPRHPLPDPTIVREKRRLPLRTILFAAFGVILIGAVLGVYAFKPPVPKHAKSIGARLDLAAGDVTVGGNGADVKALSGTPLPSGATIGAGKGARALVRTGEGAAIFLRSETSLKLLPRGVELSSGEIWLDAPRIDGDALEVKAGAYGVSASDAGLSIKRDGKDITVYVARGLAILTSPGGRVEIGAGEQGKVAAEGKPEVASVKFWNDWTGGMGDQRGSRFIGSGTGRLYGLDPGAAPGSAAKKLTIAKQVVHAVVRDGIAETEVDQTFANPGAAPIEGYYWFTIPTTATVTGFALETNGVLVEGEVIEKREAAARYEAAVRSANDPALLEWVDGRTYRARIFPIAAASSRRIVLRYIEMLPVIEGKTRYVYPLRSDDPVRFDEFALSVDVGGTEEDVDVASSLDARVENGGRLVTMRRSGYVPRADFQLEVAHNPRSKARRPVSAWRFQAGADQADYVMVRYSPDKDFAKQPSAPADVVIVVDTSAGGDDSARQLRNVAAESALRALSEQDHFALVTLDVSASVIYPKDGLAPASEKEITNALGKLTDHTIGGATDLGAMFEPALARLHGKEKAAVIYVGDGAATSGETGAEALLERLRRSLTGSRARFFAIGAGAAANHELLGQLTRAGGGQYVRIDEAGQTTSQTLRLASAIKTEAITDLAIDVGAGLDQPLYSATGKLSRGEELVLLARTHHPLPDKITVRGRFGGKEFEDKHDVKVDTTSIAATLVPRLWAAEYVRRLMGSASGTEDNRGQILQLGVEYGLITPYSSSLALESEAAYSQQGIQRRQSKVRGVRLSAIQTPADEERMMKGLLPSAPPATMMGCDAPLKSKASEPEEQAKEGAKPSPAAGGGQKAANGYAATASPTPAPPPPQLDLSPAASGFALNQPAATATVTAAPAAPATRPVDDDRGPANHRALGGAAKAAAKPSPRDSLADKIVPAKREPGPSTERGAAMAYRPAVMRALSICSDVASRPLAERIVLWQKRARKSTSGQELAQIHGQAYGACELPDWRDEAALLEVLQQRIETEQTAEVFLAHLASTPDAQRFVAKNLLRRTVDVRIAAAVSRALHGSVDWNHVDVELANTDKLDKQLVVLRTAMLAAPNDPQGDVRLVRVLARAGQRNEAIANGRRLRDRGFMTPTLAQQLGDVLAEAGEPDEALRTYSEIVEFDGQSKDARRVLGDIYQRQGWYPAAYRQYKTLTDLDGKNPLSWLRLANAAAGAGRVDEALRIEREVASGEGTPGPNDPRVFARMLSASRLATLLAQPDPQNGATPEAISRKLKELALFSGPGTMAILTWDDLDAKLVLGASDEKKETLAGEATDAGAVGLYAVLGGEGAFDRSIKAVRFKSDLLPRKVSFRVHILAWDGKSFHVSTKKGELRPSTKAEAI